MAIRPNLPVGITTVTPPAVETLVKTFQVARTDTAAFDAVVLPKYAVVSGVYVLGNTASNAATTAVISVGTNPGTTNELLASFDVKGATGSGYHPAGAAAALGIAKQMTADTKFKAIYAETGIASSAGGPWIVKVEYYIPQQGQSL